MFVLEKQVEEMHLALATKLVRFMMVLDAWGKFVRSFKLALQKAQFSAHESTLMFESSANSHPRSSSQHGIFVTTECKVTTVELYLVPDYVSPTI